MHFATNLMYYILNIFEAQMKPSCKFDPFKNGWLGKISTERMHFILSTKGNNAIV
jgi:hypothetical protein